MADLVVVGAGTMGAWTALRAARTGRSTVLLDAFGAGHPRSTSGDETRIIRSSHGPDAVYTRWSRRAREAWLRLGEEAGERFLVDAGTLWLAHRDDGFEAASVTTLTSENIPVERLTPADVERRWPQLSATGLAFAVFEPEGGLLMARRAVAAVASAARASGARFEIALVRPGSARGGRLAEVVTGNGVRFGADTFVFAAGPWLPRLFPEAVGDLIRVTKQDVLWVGAPAGDTGYDAQRFPTWVDYDASFYGIPSVDGHGIKVAPDRYGPLFDPTDGERLVDPETVRLTRRFLRRRLPALADQPIVESRVCQYETTPDTHFLIDRHPGLANVWLVGGGSGHGFKHGPVIAQHVLDLIDGNADTDVGDRFSLSRRRVPEVGVRTAGDALLAGWDA